LFHKHHLAATETDSDFQWVGREDLCSAQLKKGALSIASIPAQRFKGVGGWGGSNGYCCLWHMNSRDSLSRLLTE